MDGGEVAVSHLHHRPRLAQETRREFAAFLVDDQQLERDRSTQAQLDGLVHLGHAATPQQPDQAVTRDDIPAGGMAGRPFLGRGTVMRDALCGTPQGVANEIDRIRCDRLGRIRGVRPSR